MKVTILGKNYRTYGHLEETIEKKLSKLGKYFPEDITANVVLSHVAGRDKIETTIHGKQTIFRAEEITDDIYDGIDSVVDKLSNQMSKFKGKLQKRYNDNKALKFEFLPDMEEEEEHGKIVRTKRFDLVPMNSEEAILQMEMLGHEFFVYMDMETDSINVIYKRKDGNYGLLETTY